MTDAETLREQAPFAARWLTCPECGRGLIYHIDRNMTRCYVCNIECRRVGPWHEFDVKPEIVQITPDDLVAAMLSEIVGSTQKELARKINITEQFLSDVLKGRRAVTDVIAKYYGFRRACFFVPDAPFKEAIKDA